jgi:hypothetical protein
MNVSQVRLQLGLALTACAAACGSEPSGGTDTGNGFASLELALESTSGGGAITGLDRQGTAITVSAANANVRRIDLHLPGDKPCSGIDTSMLPSNVKCNSAKMRIEGPFAVDLITGTATPALANITLPRATYKRVDIEFEPAASLGGNTIVVSGSMPRAGAPTPFDMELDFVAQAKFENTAGVTIGGSTAQDVFLLLDVAKWFTTAPITTCVADGDIGIEGGRIKIDSDHLRGPCNMIRNGIHDAIRDSGTLRGRARP